MSGGAGLLGKTIKKLEQTIIAPSHQEMDITNYNSLSEAIKTHKPNVFLHLAAFTSPPQIEVDPMKALDVNIIGVANVVKVCAEHNVRLIYISTDYVFKGDKGNYKEEDELLPQNKYAWSKLGGECAVQLYNNSLIIRTSFIDDIFPHEKAFVDQFTSRDTVSVIAPLILSATKSDESGIIHIGTERKSVYDLAKRLKPDVGELKRSDVSFPVPFDTSFDITKLKSLKN